MEEAKLFDKYEVNTIMKVTDLIRPALHTKSKAMLAIYLSEMIKSFNASEKHCMLDIIKYAFNGKYNVINMMNFTRADAKLLFVK
jgi:hypothetical protein